MDQLQKWQKPEDMKQRHSAEAEGFSVLEGEKEST